MNVLEASRYLNFAARLYVLGFGVSLLQARRHSKPNITALKTVPTNFGHKSGLIDNQKDTADTTAPADYFVMNRFLRTNVKRTIKSTKNPMPKGMGSVSV